MPPPEAIWLDAVIKSTTEGFFREAFGLFDLLFAVFAVASAYRIASSGGEGD